MTIVKPMTKNMWRNIAGNRGRFIAIILIILLGTLIFCGVKAAGPGLNQSMTTTVTDAKLSDVQALSTTGFTAADIRAANQVKGAQAEGVKFKYAVGGETKQTVALYGYDPALKQNRLLLTRGNLPRRENEIVLDTRAADHYGYKTGDTFTFEKAAALKRRTYTVVGFADSPRYVDTAQRGVANVGDGTVRFFAYVLADQLNLAVPTLLTMRFSALQTLDPFAKAYQNAATAKLAAVKRAFGGRAQARTKQLTKDIDAQFAPKQAELDTGKAQLQAALRQIAAASGGAVTTTPELTAQQAQLDASQAQLDAAKKSALANTTTTYVWQTRSDLPGFSSYGESSERIAAIANVFPVFFFLIAALITFTTITRMVEEARGEIGTFKALGYSPATIAENFWVYALMAGLIGAILGGVIGNFGLPRIILWLYSGKYLPMTVDVPFLWGTFGLAVLVSLLATVGAAVFVAWRELSEKPAALMQPRAPKAAKRILMERIRPLWRRLSFNQKVSYRNLFRYKSRMVMTIVGIAGGTALLMTGFGLRDSISATGSEQYGTIFHYSATVALSAGHKADAALTVLRDTAGFKHATAVNTTAGKIGAGTRQVNDVTLFTPHNTTAFARDVSLLAKGKSVALPETGIVISRKIANRLDLRAGDTIHFTPTGGTRVSVKVAAVVENYMGVFAYMSEPAYEAAFNRAPETNALLATLGKQTAAQQSRLANRLLTKGEAQGTSFATDTLATIDQMAGTLAPVVVIFVLLSGALSFVVLYNLTNINMSERIRELSTVKVLGFFDFEVTMYIVRENIVMTILGILAGFGVGWGLLVYILQQAQTALIIFPVNVHWPGVLGSAALMITFTVIVMGVTHRKLQHIDMIEALKSNE